MLVGLKIVYYENLLDRNNFCFTKLSINNFIELQIIKAV